MESLLGDVAAAGSDTGVGGTWLSLAENLLRRCAEDRELFAAAVAERTGEAEELLWVVEAEAAHLVGCAATAQVHPEVAAELVSLLETHAARWEGPVEAAPVLLARALALAIDERLHVTFRSYFRDRGWTTLEPGRAYPVHRYDLLAPTPLIAGRPNTHPENLTADPARLPHLRLAGERSTSVRFVLDWDAYGRLEGLARANPLRIAVCQSSLFKTDFGLDWYGQPPSQRFRNRGPTVANHDDVLAQQLDAALDKGADVVVFAEYAVALAQRDALLARLHERIAQREAGADVHVPILVVAGSSEVELSPGRYQNLQLPCSLAAGSQAFVAVAVAPALWSKKDDGEEAKAKAAEGRVQAAFHGPYEAHPTALTRPRPSEPADRRGVWIFDAYKRKVRRTQVPKDG